MIDQLLEAARQAPSARNLQPWNFYVINDIERNKRIGKAIEPRLIAAYPNLAGGADNAGVSNLLFYDAPCVIYCTVKKDGIHYRDFDTGIAVAYMLLVAEELGLGTVPVGWAYEYGQDIIPKEINMADDEYFFLALPVGFPHESVKRSEKTRRDTCWKYIE